MTPPAPPGDPRKGSLGCAARRLLDDRHVMDAESADFATNRHFRRLHGGCLDGPEKPVVLFTACPHDLLAQGAAVPDDAAEWAASPPPVTVDGRAVPVLGTDREAARSVLAVERGSPALYRGDVIMYRELHPGGLCEWGASGLFFGLNDWGNTELRLCYMAGELCAFLEHLKPLYDRIGLDGPFTVFLSIRNSGRLVLGGYGTGGPARPSYPGQSWPPARADPATGSANVQWWHAFGSASDLAKGGAAQAVVDMVAYVCGEYSADDPGCLTGKRFPWDRWLRARSEALERCRA